MMQTILRRISLFTKPRLLRLCVARATGTIYNRDVNWSVFEEVMPCVS